MTPSVLHTPHGDHHAQDLISTGSVSKANTSTSTQDQLAIKKVRVEAGHTQIGMGRSVSWRSTRRVRIPTNNAQSRALPDVIDLLDKTPKTIQKEVETKQKDKLHRRLLLRWRKH